MINYNPNIPNLYIIGAPRCGTTSLYNYLTNHPAITGSKLHKEPHYFCTDWHAYWQSLSPLGKQAYENLYPPNKKNTSYTLDGSTWYLSSAVALAAINKEQPEAKIIICLRNPSEMMHSLYYKNKYNGIEKASTFEEALALEQERKAQGTSLNLGYQLYYWHVADYAAQLKKAYSIFPKEQIKIVLFSKLNQQPEKVYTDLLNWLHLPMHHIDFTVYNANHTYKSKFLHQLTNKPPSWFKFIVRLLTTSRMRSYLYTWLKNKNILPVERPILLPTTEKIIHQKFKASYLELQQNFGIPTTNWYNTF